MGRSFFRPAPENTIEDYVRNNTFIHEKSGDHYVMYQRGGNYFQRRYQLGLDGQPVNVDEKQIDYVIGSGNHVRVYLSRTVRNTFLELPLAWYAENGGHWGMNPGYDRPDHPRARREINYDCIFCHNAYPVIPPGHEQAESQPQFVGGLPEGIDCQRCHGPGERHIQTVQRAGVSQEQIRQSIVNPARLSPERQQEVCIQCHLETTSFRLPHSIIKYGRGPFSYRPGEPIENYEIFLDEKPGSRDDRFELVNAVYRLRKSQCFLKTNGAVTCTTCHNPHDIPHGEKATAAYDAVCRQCHAVAVAKLVAAAKHPSGGSCTACHMPKRRTEDVVHVVMTDHLIQRKPTGDYLAALPEQHEDDETAYHGEVLPYPKPLAPTPENQLYLDIAQIRQKSNLKEGIARLTADIEKYHPQRAEYYFELANAWRDAGDNKKAIPYYQEAIRRKPDYTAAFRSLAVTLLEERQYAPALATFQRTLQTSPSDVISWQAVGELSLQLGKPVEALTALRKALALDPDMPEAHNSLASLYASQRQFAKAEHEFREAIRVRPDYAEALSNLGNLLSMRDETAEATECFEKAIKFSPQYALAHFNYGSMLNGMGHFDAAEGELAAALKIDNSLADAHALLGNLHERKGDNEAALHEYQEAVRLRPANDRAQLDLGAVLAKTGDTQAAIPHLKRAAASADPRVREFATQLLQKLSR